ncbi:carbon storage regulator CsrA [Paenibacillus sp. WQ 127069]|uniref:Translational regulator CsrA n=1 Tax=Paenibacillus baimaensis TaxID=2982185 RepID=A0ABT2UGB4_9BACL|nr:carbon storage regulator CsrA [Paenibacillus sp. WQ 127069]MCU6792942.1 carbon storage regulator CsrA [Paenibacillus sp. WQ 127069]
MLVLSRKKGESIIIGDHIEVIILESEGDVVKIGIQAPKSVDVYRKEVYEQIKQMNQESTISRNKASYLGKMFKNKTEQ